MHQSNASTFNIIDLGGATELQFIMRSMIGKVNTGELVEVISVSNDGLSPVGFVSVRPLVYKIDGDNTNIERPIIHNVPYFRLQGGTNAIIIDPQVGDIGFCGFSSRDISLVKRTRKAAAPNIKSNYGISDALYFGGMLNGTPEQYVWFKEGGEVVVKATTKVTIDAPLTHCTGNLTAAGTIKDLSASSGVTMDAMRTAYNGHNHTEQGDGQPTSPPNTPMG